MVTKIVNARLITDKVIDGQSLYVKNGKIIKITADDMAYHTLIDAQNNYLSPGFIDIHTHGGGGQDFMDGGINPIAHAAKIHLEHGTTTIIPTTLASDISTLKKTINDIRDAMKSVPTIYGIHLEGPYFSIAQCGAQNPLYITNPIEKDYEEIIELGKGIIKRWSFAPELVGSERFIKTLIKSGIIPSIAHSDGTYEDFVLAYNLGCRLVTHLYSGMSMLTRKNGYRRLGIVESALLFDDVMVEVIADGVHLPPELLKLIVKTKGYNNICLVTDSMRAAGMGEGNSILGTLRSGIPCIVEDGVAKLLDRTSFAGSVATADRLVRTMVKDACVPLPSAIKMITENPANTMKIPNKGRLAVGFDADFVLFDEEINVKQVIVSGKPIA